MKQPPLPLVAALVSFVGATAAAAAPEAAAAAMPALQLTGNPTIDAIIVTGVLMPVAASLGWAVKFTCGAGIAGVVAGLRAWADFVEARAKASKDPGDDAPAHAGAAFARAFAAALERAESPKSGNPIAIPSSHKGDVE